MPQSARKTMIKDNPEASPKQLEDLAKRDRLSALRHPNASPEQLALWLSPERSTGRTERLAALEENPALVLFTLEDASPQHVLLCEMWTAKYYEAFAKVEERLAKINNHRQVIRLCARACRDYMAALCTKYPIAAKVLRPFLAQIGKRGDLSPKDRATLEQKLYAIRVNQDGRATTPFVPILQLLDVKGLVQQRHYLGNVLRQCAGEVVTGYSSEVPMFRSWLHHRAHTQREERVLSYFSTRIR